MLTNFALFFLTTILILFFYYITNKKYNWLILLFASIVLFICLCGIGAIPYLLFGVFTAYFSGLLISNTEEVSRKKIILGISLTLIFSELLILKQFINLAEYSTFFTKFLFFNSEILGIKLATPIAISFYTLSITSYVIDIYRGIQIPEKNPLKFLLFSCYFPQMSIGPVTRYNKMQKEFFEEKSFSYIEVKKAFERILWGLFKKIVIADRLAIIINNTQANYEDTSGCILLIATLLFGLQLYMDFSGGIDIVLGISQAFKIKLPENFNNPYFSKSVEEYWRRWHISLHTWFRDYIFWPILISDFAQNFQKKLEKYFKKETCQIILVYFAYTIVWFLIGIWHCAEPRFFVTTTIIPLVSIIISDIFGKLIKRINFIKKLKKNNNMLYNTTCCIFTYIIISAPWGFFIAKSVKEGLEIINKIFTSFNAYALQNGEIFLYGLDIKDFILIFICLLIVFIISLLKEKGYKIREEIEKLPLPIQWGMIYGIITVILIFGIYGPECTKNDFIYFQF